MALSANTVLEIRHVADFAGASDTNGGGFVTGAGGTDWSQQGAPQYSVTDGVTAGTTTITSASASFGTDVVGNLISVTGGTGSVAQGWYQIASRTNATTIVVDRSTGLTAGTGVTLKIGGCFASPGAAAALMTVTGITAWWKYSTTVFTCTTSTVGAAGPIAISGQCRLEGYDQTRGDRTGNRPTISWGSVSLGALTYLIVPSANSHPVIANCVADANSVTNGACVDMSAAARNLVTDVLAQNASAAGGIGLKVTAAAVRCKALNCVTGFSGAGNFQECWASGGTTGFSGILSGVKCVASGMATGFTTGGVNLLTLSQCVADSCTSIGIDASSPLGANILSCLASNCSGGGAIGIKAGANVALINCGTYNNATHVSGTPQMNEGQITPGADPYVSQATGDFRLNSNNPGGAQLRAQGIGVFGQTDTVDTGAVQSTPGGGNTFIFQVEA
jgi:hypothetical protein